MSEYAIFVSSSDSYADLWPIFFGLFKKYWPENNGKIYLQTQEKHFEYPGLKIECTNVGMLNGFGATLLAGLNKVAEEIILFFMIDYIFMGHVNDSKVNEYYKHFCEEKLDTFVLFPQPFQNVGPSNRSDCQVAIPPCSRRMFGYQTAFWKKQVLMDLILPHENPWMSEWYGSSRAEKMRIREESLKSEFLKSELPIPYDARGCLHQGKWLDNAVEFLKKECFDVDFSKRGLYDDAKGYKSFSSKLKIKYSIWSAGLKGSWWDLVKRKPIH